MDELSEGDEVLWESYRMDGTKKLRAGVVERIDHSKFMSIKADCFGQGHFEADDSVDFHLLEDFAKRHEIKYMKS